MKQHHIEIARSLPKEVVTAIPLELQSELPKEMFLQTGEFHFGGGMTRLRTLLGSCVSVTFWHPQARIGGMCHYLLPSRGRSLGHEFSASGLYADEVIDIFANEVRAAGTRPRDYVVKFFGGGNMFPQNMPPKTCAQAECRENERTSCRIVSCKNILAARELLEARGFCISAEDVGGNGSRQLMFDLWSGDAWLRFASSQPPAAPSAITA